MRAVSNRIRAISKAVKKQEPPAGISICWRDDGLVEWDLPNGETELVTEAEFRARGGILIKWEGEIDND